MAIFNELNKKISTIGQDAIKRTKDLSESVKVSGLIRDEIEKQKDLFCQLGQRIYKSGRTYEEADIQNLIVAIQTSEEKQIQYQEQLKQLKKVMKCPNCNAEIPADAIFCNKCGEKIQQEVPDYISTGNSQFRCKNCGALLEDDQMFCVRCGTKVEASEIPLQQESDELSADKQTASEPVDENEQKYCPNCNSALKEGQTFCTNCGIKLIKLDV